MSGTSAERNVPITAVKHWRVGSPTDITLTDALAALPATDTYVSDERGATPGTAKAPQSSVSAGRIVMPVEDGTLVLLKFFGAGSDNGATASGAVRVWLWEKEVIGGSSQRVQWTKHLVATLTLTMGTKTGAASGLVDSDHRYVDTIAVVLDGGFTGTTVYGRKSGGTLTADNEAQAVGFDGMGCEFVEVEASLNGGSSITGLNVLYRTLASA